MKAVNGIVTIQKTQNMGFTTEDALLFAQTFQSKRLAESRVATKAPGEKHITTIATVFMDVASRRLEAEIDLEVWATSRLTKASRLDIRWKSCKESCQLLT